MTDRSGCFFDVIEFVFVLKITRFKKIAMLYSRVNTYIVYYSFVKRVCVSVINVEIFSKSKENINKSQNRIREKTYRWRDNLQIAWVVKIFYFPIAFFYFCFIYIRFSFIHFYFSSLNIKIEKHSFYILVNFEVKEKTKSKNKIIP